MSGQTMKMARVMNADCLPLDTDKAHRDTRPSFIVCRHHRAKKIKDTSTTRTKPLSSINNPRPPALIHTLPGKLNSDDYSATCTKVATCKKHSRNMHKVILAYLGTVTTRNHKPSGGNCINSTTYVPLTGDTQPHLPYLQYISIPTKLFPQVYKAQGGLSVSSRPSAEK